MSEGRDFWARRRAGVAAEAEAERAAAEAHALKEQQAALEDMSDEELLEELNLPDPDTLVQGDDFKVFMEKAVPDRIRRRALRTLWRSNPVLANVDMLVDYGEDFTDAAMAVENIQTAYQVGKGMLKHVEEMARQAEEKEMAAEDAEGMAEADDTSSDADQTAEDQGAETADTERDTPVLAACESRDMTEPDEDEATAAFAVPRRMKFRIEETA